MIVLQTISGLIIISIGFIICYFIGKFFYYKIFKDNEKIPAIMLIFLGIIIIFILVALFALSYEAGKLLLTTNTI